MYKHPSDYRPADIALEIVIQTKKVLSHRIRRRTAPHPSTRGAVPDRAAPHPVWKNLNSS